MDLYIRPPKGCAPEDIIKEITVKGNSTKVTMKYPNGFILVYESDGIENKLSLNGLLTKLVY